MQDNRFGGRAALLAAALIWGSSFIVMKDAVSDVPVFHLLAIRFTIAAPVLAAVFFGRLKRMERKTLRHGLICGFLLLTAYAFQTFGLTETTPGKNAFLTAIYCVLVPFMAWGLYRSRPAVRNWVAAAVCIVGIGLVSLTGEFTVSRGDGLTLISGVFYALHIMALTHFTRQGDALSLTVIQFATVAVLSWLAALVTESPIALPQSGWPQLLYLGVCCTAVTLSLQSIGQKLTPPSQAAILLSLESVFGVFFSLIADAEHLTVRMFIGFALIFTSVLISEIEWPKRRKCP